MKKRLLVPGKETAGKLDAGTESQLRVREKCSTAVERREKRRILTEEAVTRPVAQLSTPEKDDNTCASHSPIKWVTFRLLPHRLLLHFASSFADTGLDGASVS